MKTPRPKKSAAAAKPAPASPPPAPPSPAASTADAYLDDARLHLYHVAAGMAARFKHRLKDRDYHPTPNDLSAVFGAIRSLEEHAAGLSTAFSRVTELKGLVESLRGDLKAAEDRLLAIISSSKAPDSA